MRKTAILIAALVLTGCEGARSYDAMRSVCKPDATPKMEVFILECVRIANPMSDEEPEDWIAECRQTAKDLYCPVVPVTIYQHSSGFMQAPLTTEIKVKDAT